ncbi:hypothetical protein [Spirillospora albida]|uniref:hypothetical protein n=1 Tax=Spirillospora albida TaxID=58123 RepID=UPI001B8078A9|nr:hypothetical protein [Spirillospora albida]
MLSVGFAPHVIFVAGLWGLVRANAFSGPGQWADSVPRTPAGVAGTVLGVCGCAAVLGLLLHPFQVRAVRMLEGYWDRWTPTARLADLLMAYQRRRWRATDAIARGGRERNRESGTGGPEETHDLVSARDRTRADASHRLAALPPVDVLLPTALGNALRAGELGAGERYGVTTLASWPRIYPQVSRPLAGALESARDTLDSSVNLCYSFLACAVASAAAVYDEPEMWWLPTASLCAATVAYKGAVTAAQAYARLMHVVYDLHRFDLVRALHYRLPGREEEWALFRRISDALAGHPVNLPYDHGQSSSDGTDGSS